MTCKHVRVKLYVGFCSVDGGGQSFHVQLKNFLYYHRDLHRVMPHSERNMVGRFPRFFLIDHF